MKELVIISGKGGTGKTSIVSAFASLASSHVLCDTDVDAADLHLIMNPTIKEQHVFIAGHKARIDREKCSACGKCIELCRWNAISDKFIVDSFSCEGCGVCRYFCPEQAIQFLPNTCGEWYISSTRYGKMVHAKLGIAEENSGKLVALIRRKAKEIAEENHLDLILTDGPPGVGCPVIASIGGASAVLIVTEPTVSGKHDLERVAQLVHHFNVPAMICINKSDINPSISIEIEKMAQSLSIDMLGHIPFDPIVTIAMINGKTVFEYDSTSGASYHIKSIWEKLHKNL